MIELRKLESLPDQSRVWIYQADRNLSIEEERIVRAAMESFVKDWRSHGDPVEGAFDVFYSRFLVLAANTVKVEMGGCSIDSSVGVVRALGEKLHLDFFDRKKVAWRKDEQIIYSDMAEFWALRKSGKINDSTIVFNNLVVTLGEFNGSWEGSFAHSWHAEMW